ncbi:MAG TPA: DUF5317 domain-containing protein [Actinomycetota bacterium]|nr:DUF5317 domain-containing protein [Actinomycetota bacterium]
MILLIAVVALAIALGLLLKGSFRGFEDLRLRWWGLVVVGLALQLVPLPGADSGTDLVVRVAVLAVSYALLILFAALNVRWRGMPLVLIGLALNALVIVANGGMPVSAEAIEASGQADMLDLLIEEGAAKHHLMTDDDVLTPLADVIPIPPPVGQIVSVGDLFVYAGIVWLVVVVMRGRTRPKGLGWLGPYRGKHRGRGAQASMSPAPLPPRPATTSGSAQ